MNDTIVFLLSTNEGGGFVRHRVRCRTCGKVLSQRTMSGVAPASLFRRARAHVESHDLAG